MEISNCLLSFGGFKILSTMPFSFAVTQLPDSGWSLLQKEKNGLCGKCRNPQKLWAKSISKGKSLQLFHLHFSLLFFYFKFIITITFLKSNKNTWIFCGVFLHFTALWQIYLQQAVCIKGNIYFAALLRLRLYFFRMFSLSNKAKNIKNSNGFGIVVILFKAVGLFVIFGI